MHSLWTSLFQLVIVNVFLVYNSLGLTLGASFYCAARREISPCICRHQEENTGVIQVTCERMSSFSQVVSALQYRFEPQVTISLAISNSSLEDLAEFNFQNLTLNINNLKLNADNLSVIPDSVFKGLVRTEYLSLSDNSLYTVPRHVFKQMPVIKTLDLGRCQIQNLTSADFQNLPMLRTLILASNDVTFMDNNSIPESLRNLHIGKNALTTLNGTLRGLSGLDWLFINENNLTNLDGELPEIIPNTKMTMLEASSNNLERLPLELRHFQVLDALFAHNNQITSLNGALAKSRRLKKLHLDFNNLTTISEDDFAEAEKLEFLQLAFNQLVSLNSSLLPVRNLQFLNLSHNLLPEFSLQEIRGLHNLNVVDLSYNKITKLKGRMENLVELETRVIELKLDHNQLETLSGALTGLNKLQRLNISHNHLVHISTDDLIVLDDLRILDISYNKLTTLDELSKTMLPRLEELIASYNALTVLEKDFHGLPALCRADLSYNQIQIVSKELPEKTQCQIHGVNRALTIYLNENPVWCDNAMLEIIKQMEYNNKTKIYGTTNCMTEVNNTLIGPLASIA